MRPLDEFAKRLGDSAIRLKVDPDRLTRAAHTVEDDFFHTPLLALTILVIARAKTELRTADLATWTGATLTRQFSGLRSARRRFDWSFALRRRCADALVFLENASFVVVRDGTNRTVSLSLQGRELVLKVLKRADESGVLARSLDRSYRAVEQLGLELL